MREVPREKMAKRLVTWGLIPRGVHRGIENFFLSKYLEVLYYEDKIIFVH